MLLGDHTECTSTMQAEDSELQLQEDRMNDVQTGKIEPRIGRDMWKSPSVSPRRLSDISPQLRQLKLLVVEEEIKEEFKSSRSMEDIKHASVEERILRITGYYGYQPWSSNTTVEEEPSKERMDVKIDDHPGTTVREMEGLGRLQGLLCCLCWTLIHLRQAVWGVTVLLCACSSWSGSTQLAKQTLRQINIPFTLTWFSTSWNFIFFPLYYLGHLCCNKDRQSFRQRFRECSQFLGEEGLSVRTLLSLVAPSGVLWTLTSYLYLQGLRRIPPTDASALFCCSRAFVFLISWIVLRDRFMAVRIVAAILAIAGIVMITYADGFHGYSVIGISLVVGSASTAAMYKVLFKLALSSAKLGEAALYLTVLGGANMLFLSIVPLILLLTGAEDFGSPREIPWHSLCGMAALMLVINFLFSFGVLITLPTLISLSVVLSVPVNAVIDRSLCTTQFTSVRIVAVVTICLSFLLLLLPADWDQLFLRLCTTMRNRKQPQEGSINKHTEVPHIRSSKSAKCNSKTAPKH